MPDYLAPLVFVGFMAILYFSIVSRYGILERKLRARESQREALRRDCVRQSQSSHEPYGSAESYNGRGNGLHEPASHDARKRN